MEMPQEKGTPVVADLNRFHTAEALPDIVRGLRARGYELVTISEMLRSSHGTASVTQRE